MNASTADRKIRLYELVMENGASSSPYVWRTRYAAEVAMVRLFDTWFSMQVMRRMFRVYALNIHDAARPEDRGYFRQSRQKFLKGVTLEAFTADRVGRPTDRMARPGVRSVWRTGSRPQDESAG